MVDSELAAVLLIAIPTGKLGDLYGRRKVMAGSLLGVMGSLIVVFTVCKYFLSVIFMLRQKRVLTGPVQAHSPQVFPLRLVWVGSVFLLVGGGLYTATALMWAMAFEVCDDKGRLVSPSSHNL